MYSLPETKRAIKMPKPYLQNDEIWDLTQKFKLYCYFDKKYWDDITDSNNLTDFENIYNSEFYTKYAIDGDSHIKNRLKSIYACAASPQVDIHNVL